MSKWVCKNCETENDESVSICSLCGAKRDAQYTDNSEQSVPSYDSQRQTNGNQYSRQQTSGVPSDTRETVSNGDELRELIRKYEGQKNLFKGLVIACVFMQLILFACQYIQDNIVQICSILLVCITIAPAVAVCIKLNVRKRNLPVTISVIVSILTTIYSVVIWFGSLQNGFPVTAVPAFIIANVWATVVFAVNMVKTLDKLDNAMYRPTGF